MQTWTVEQSRDGRWEVRHAWHRELWGTYQTREAAEKMASELNNADCGK